MHNPFIIFRKKGKVHTNWSMILPTNPQNNRVYGSGKKENFSLKFSRNGNNMQLSDPKV